MWTSSVKEQFGLHDIEKSMFQWEMKKNGDSVFSAFKKFGCGRVERENSLGKEHSSQEVVGALVVFFLLFSLV